MPATNVACVISEIERVSRVRMIFNACGTQHKVVNTAAAVPMAGTHSAETIIRPIAIAPVAGSSSRFSHDGL
jgi:hypothetical protein